MKGGLLHFPSSSRKKRQEFFLGGLVYFRNLGAVCAGTMFAILARSQVMPAEIAAPSGSSVSPRGLQPGRTA